MTFGCFAGLGGFDCSLAWIIMIVLFFIAAIFRRQIADGLLGVGFSLIGATILGEAAFIVSLYLFEGMKMPFIFGTIGVIVGGFIGTIWLEDGE